MLSVVVLPCSISVVRGRGEGASAGQYDDHVKIVEHNAVLASVIICGS